MEWTIDRFEDIGSFWELRDFCNEFGTYPDDVDLDNVVDAEYISEQIQEMASDYRWDDITDALRDLNWNGNNYEEFEWGDNIRELTGDDLQNCKDEVLETLHEDGVYLPGEDEYEDEDDEDDVDGTEGEAGLPWYGGCMAGSHSRGLYGNIRMDGCYEEEQVVKCTLSDDDLMAIIQGR